MIGVGAKTMPLNLNLIGLKILIHKPSSSRPRNAISIGKSMPSQLNFSPLGLPFTVRRNLWSVRSASDGSGLNPSTNDSTGKTCLMRTIQSIRSKITARIDELRKNLPVKLFSFLVGFYCATAFATVIGQTGDWDVFSAALAVAVVEGIGALMYRASHPLVENVRDLVVVFNYWKTGLSLGLFLDSFNTNSDEKVDIRKSLFHGLM